MPDIEIIDLTPENIADYGVCGYKNVKKTPGTEKKNRMVQGILSKRIKDKSNLLKKKRLSRYA